MTPLLQTYKQLLHAGASEGNHEYVVPGVWLGESQPIVCRSGYSYLLRQLEDIERRSRDAPVQHSPGTERVYAASVRQLTSYDHGAASCCAGWRSTGTFLKLAALLPYLLRLNVNTLLLSPVSSIGVIGRKGSLGSPYAVRDPYSLDPMLLEPTIPMSLEDQARVLVECCHSVGMQVVLEFALRTASIDADTVREHPEWYYWIDEGRAQEMGGFTAPEFSDQQVEVIETIVSKGDRSNLPAPSGTYTALYHKPPMQVERDSHGWRGVSYDGAILRIPGAFADWPVRDAQPAWTDVTYLKLYDHPDFNYMAYNTVRMYDARLQQVQNRNDGLWEHVAQIVPSYIEKYSIDGAMIDMGHALPAELLAEIVLRTRRLKPSFIMLEENFTLARESVDQGYDAVVGSIPFVALNVDDLRQYLEYLSGHPPEQRYLATSETHNTPRTHGRVRQTHVPGLCLFLQALPGAISTIHSGIEMGETTPVNTGLGFSKEEQQRWEPAVLPLFSDVPLCWDQAADVARVFMNLTAYRLKQESDRCCAVGETIECVSCSSATVLAYIRWNLDGRTGVLACWNSESNQQNVVCRMHEAHLCHNSAPLQGNEVHLSLSPGECLLIPVSKASITKAD